MTEKTLCARCEHDLDVLFIHKLNKKLYCPWCADLINSLVSTDELERIGCDVVFICETVEGIGPKDFWTIKKALK